MNRCLFLTIFLLGGAALRLSAQGTAFNYQGRLSDTGAAANGSYDFRFAAYNAVTNGSLLAAPVTNSAVPVTNGLFSATVDFGAGVFTGTNCWLDLGVRTNGGTNFTALLPRQPVLPVPYAIFATSASNLTGTLPAAQLTGTLPSAQVSGNYANAVSFTNAGNVFSGNGAGLSALPAGQLTGTVADQRLSANVPLLNANQTFTGANNFSGAVTSTGANQFNGVNTFTNMGNSFTGSFFGNGLVGWVVVSTNAVSAAIDHGYLLTNAQFTTVTLPTNCNAGDIVRISGVGAGGWRTAMAAGQTVFGSFYTYSECLPSGLGNGGDWRSVAASADRSRMFAVGNNNSGVQASYNFGKSWGKLPVLTGNYNSVACSADGRTVYAVVGTSVEKFVEGGSTWSVVASGSTVACSANGSNYYTTGITCSGDGTYQGRLVSGAVQVSTNAGSTWSGSIPGPTSVSFTCLAVSSDCTKLVGGVSNGLLYASANLGATWTAVTATNQVWAGVWISADGGHFAGATRATTLQGSTGDIFYYDFNPQSSALATNSISGSQGSAVELQYTGGGQFVPVSSSGKIWAN